MIKVQDLYKGYQQKEGYVIKDVSLQVAKGTIHGLIGDRKSVV